MEPNDHQSAQPRTEVMGDGMPGKTVLVRATLTLPDGQPVVAILEVNTQALAGALIPAIVREIALQMQMKG